MALRSTVPAASQTMAMALLPPEIQSAYLSDPAMAFNQSLMQLGASTAPVYSPLEGIARALTGAVGGFFAGRKKREYEQAGQDYRETMARALAAEDLDTARSILAGNPYTSKDAMTLALLGFKTQAESEARQKERQANMELFSQVTGWKPMGGAQPGATPQSAVAAQPAAAMSAGAPADLETMAPRFWQAETPGGTHINPKTGKPWISPTGAIGVGQLMPATAEYLGVDPYDEEQNREGSSRYIAELYGKYGDWTLAAMAYNWGPGNVDNWLARGANWDSVPKETREYVRKVVGDGAVGEQVAGAAAAQGFGGGQPSAGPSGAPAPGPDAAVSWFDNLPPDRQNAYAVAFALDPESAMQTMLGDMAKEPPETWRQLGYDPAMGKYVQESTRGKREYDEPAKINTITVEFPPDHPTRPGEKWMYDAADREGLKAAMAEGAIEVKTPATQVNIAGEERPIDKELAKVDAETLKSMTEAASQARHVKQMMLRVLPEIDKFPTGAGGDIILSIGKVLNQLGVDVGDMSPGEIIGAFNTQMAVLQRAPGSGPTTDFEFAVYMKAVPGLMNTPEGNRKLIEWGVALADRKLQELQIARDYLRDHDGLDAGYYEKVEALGPVLPEGALDELASASAGGAPAASSAAGGNRSVPPTEGVIDLQGLSDADLLLQALEAGDITQQEYIEAMKRLRQGAK